MKPDLHFVGPVLGRWPRLFTLLACLGTAACGGGGSAATPDGNAQDTPPLDAPAASDAGADSAATVDGTGDVPADAPGSGAVSVPDAVLAACLWSTACLNTEDSPGGAAPNTTVGACVSTFLSQGGGGIDDWADLEACAAAQPRSCVVFRMCLLDRQAICPVPSQPGQLPKWTAGALCADGTRSCAAGGCPVTCGADGNSCAADKAALQVCSSGPPRLVSCSRPGLPGTCLVVGASAACVEGQVGTCAGPNAASCDGTSAVVCNVGIEFRHDCALLGETCVAASGCTKGNDCTYMDDACDGTKLLTCFNGHRRTVDCAQLGGSCGAVRGAPFACRLPDGAQASDGGANDVGGGDGASALDAFEVGGASDASAGDGPVACNAVANAAPLITTTRVAQEFMPNGQGGSLVDGTYHHTGSVEYTGVGGPTTVGSSRRDTLVLSDGASGTATAQIVGSEDGGAEQRSTYVFKVVGQSIQLTRPCPASGDMTTWPFTAVDNTLILYNTNNARLETYTRQP